VNAAVKITPRVDALGYNNRRGKLRKTLEVSRQTGTGTSQTARAGQ